ncbi:hypothetical protein SVIOM342S_00837 [Streptomyces violaceorubidus]
MYPSSVVPGDRVVATTAVCGKAGSASGDASAVGAGAFPLAPGTGEGEATGHFEVPPGAQPGTYEIVATCGDDERRVTGDLVVTLTSAAEQVYPQEA